jgi:IclR-like helix-turn-helix domain-containing protein
MLAKAMRDKHTSRTTAPKRGGEGRRVRSAATEGKSGVSMSRSAPQRAERSKQRSARTMGDKAERGRVFIQLTEDQVERVIVRKASDSVSGSRGDSTAQGKRSGHSTQWLFRTLMEDRSLSHSLLIGLQVLTCFPLDGTERGVAEVAKQLEMNNSTVHRYMSTLMRIGLLEQDLYTRLYRLANADLDGNAR